MPTGENIKSLHSLLKQRNANPDRAPQIDRDINRRFRCRRAIHVLDMSGFSVSTQRHGIIHHLAKIQRMHSIVSTEVGNQKGSVLKFEADNAFSVFKTVNAAIKASREICRGVAEANAGAGPVDQINVARGIGYGQILLASDDFFGDEVNLASKLGEDIAQSGEVLLTPEAVNAVRGKAHRLESLDLSISGIHLRAAKLTL